MGLLRQFALIAASLWLAVGSMAADARPSIRVDSGDWGAASVQDIEAVLQSVAAVLLPDFPDLASARIIVAPGAAGPRVLAQKSPDGAHQVLLNVRDARWDQFAYQFAHELCHIASNYERRDIGAALAPRRHQWFEETLCEVVSVVALNRLSSRWVESAPYPAWAGYAPSFRRYAAQLLDEAHRQLVPGHSIAAWYQENSSALEGNAYLRQQNEIAATALLALFEAVPGSLAAIGYLNLSPADERFAAFLASWRDCCPESQRAFVQQVISLFAAA